MRSLIIQTCVPHYRLPLFDTLAARLGSGFSVAAGDRFFEPSLQTAAQGRSWYQPCENVFLLNNRLLWQRKLPHLDQSGLALVLEGNPRIQSTWLTLLNARRLGIRTAIWGHALGRTVHAQKMGRFRAAMFSLGNDIICYGFLEAALLRIRFPGKRIYVAGNSVLRRDDCRAVGSPSGSRRNVLFLGRLTSGKKPFLLLEALRLLQQRGLPIGGLFVGEGPERANLEAMTRECRIAGVQFTGQQESLDRLRGFAAESFCMASPGYAGLSLLHAQGFGLPFVFSNDEPNAPEIEIADPGHNSLTFRGSDVVSLADRLTQIYQEREVWLARGNEFARRISERYTIEKMAESFARFFGNEAPGEN